MYQMLHALTRTQKGATLPDNRHLLENKEMDFKGNQKRLIGIENVLSVLISDATGFLEVPTCTLYTN